MYIRFKKVLIHNFLSFADEEVSLEDLGYTVVTGKNNRKVDNAISNGSGKSTIFNAVCYALTGETAQGLSNNLENCYINSNECWVELHFDIDDTSFIVKRIRKPMSNLEIYINGVNASGKGIKESTRLLQQYIPDIDSRLLGSIIILGQGLPYRFTNNHPGGRKELLEKLTKSDYMVQSIREKLDFRMEELKQHKRQIEDSMVANSATSKMTRALVASNVQELFELEQSADTDLAKLKEDLSLKEDELEAVTAKLADKRQQLADVESDLSAATSHYYEELEQIRQKFDEKVAPVNGEMLELKATVSTLLKQIKAAKNMPETCPTCGQKIPESHKIDVSSLEHEHSDAKAHLKELEKSASEIETSRARANELALTEHTAKKDHLDKTRSDLQTEMTELNAKVNQVSAEVKSLSVLETKVSMISESIRKLKQSIDDNSETLKNLEDEYLRLESDLANSQDHIRVIQSLITLTKKEFRGVLLENVIRYINSRCLKYSEFVFGTDLLTFELNENYIDIKYDNKYYEALSGGEKQKVDIIIQLAIRDLMSAQLGIRSNLLVCDETLDNLDNQGCLKILSLISEMVTDAESVFIISNRIDSLNISYDSELMVVKEEDGISRIRHVS